MVAASFIAAQSLMSTKNTVHFARGRNRDHTETGEQGVGFH